MVCPALRLKRRGLMVSDQLMRAGMERTAQTGGIATVHRENGDTGPGQVLVKDGELVDPPPHGEFLERPVGSLTMV
jgi:hypothetical protein